MIYHDARKRRKITITEQHIKNAEPGNKENCVVAQSLKAQHDVFYAEVGPKFSTVVTLGKSSKYLTSPELSEALKHFDEHKSWPLAPGNYYLLPISHSLQRPQRRAQNKKHGAINRARRKAGIATKKRASLNIRTFNFLRKTRVIEEAAA